MNFILLAVPAFFILIAIELTWNFIKKSGYYRLNDTVNSLAMGMLSRVTGAVYKLVPFSLYFYFYEDFAMLTWESSIWTWVAAFVLYDLSYYWNHRIGHIINIGWASHVIHHSSEEYNLSTALRQTSIPNPLGLLCYIPLALVGFPPEVLLAVGSFNLIYQFWVHTQLINRMPDWYEAIFITPSNHRVHHAKNKIYVDKNFGGVFLLWDRLFKTFQPELKEEKVIFGISTQLASWNPLWGNIKVLSGLFKDAWRTKSWFDKLTLWFRRTGYRPADVEERFPIVKSNTAVEKFDTPLSTMAKWYVLFQYIIISVASVSFMALVKDMDTIQLLVSGFVIAFSLFSLGKYQENNRHSFVYELIKYLSAFGASFWLLPTIPSITIAIASYGIFSLIAISYIQRQSTNLQTA